MSNRTVIIILAVAAALLAFIFFFERETMTTSELAERKGRVFKEFKRDAVTRISVNGKASEEIVLERDQAKADLGEEHWLITSPSRFDADESEVRALLSAIDYLMIGRAVQGEETRGDPRFGLAEPRLEASFAIRDRTTTFKMGGDAKGDLIYLESSDSPGVIYAIDKEFLTSMDKELGDLRSKRVVPDEIKKAVRVEVKRTIGPVRLEREGEDDWRIEAGGKWILAAADQVREVLQTAADLRVERFVADRVKEGELGMYGLVQPAVSITAGLPEGDEISLLLGGDCPGDKGLRHATVSGTGTVTCVKDELAPVAERPMIRYQETRPAVFRDDEVTRISLSGEGQSLILEKDDDQWKAKGKDKITLDSDAVSELLEALGETRAKKIEVGDEAVSGLGEPSNRVSLTLDGDQGEIALELFPEKEQGLERLRRAGEPAVLSFEAGLRDKLSPDILRFRSRRIETGSAFDIEALSIEGAASQRFKKVDGTWKIQSPLEVDADSSAVRSLADLISEVEVKRFAAASAAPEHGLDRPFAVVRARSPKEDKTDGGAEDRTGTREVVLEIGSMSGENERYARLAGDDPAVLVVGEDYLNAVARPLVARDLFQIDDTEVVKLALESGDRRLVLSRDDEKWKAEDGSAFDEKTLKRLLTDLAGVKTVSAVSFGKGDPSFEKPELTLRSWTGEQLEKDAPAVMTVGARSADEKEDGYLARLGGVDVTFVLPARIIDDLKAFAASE